jgi:hypothetical protein
MVFALATVKATITPADLRRLDPTAHLVVV